ncbi:MAG TPA: B12-binding domain-containing radical SAM protein [Bacteroidales bacterium]|nr:B12-binding domain-containing radical SAM protein [Bacteroidales bacterium]
MNVLLVWPRYPDTYWSFNYALKFISKKSSNVPLGLITVASLLPPEWNKKLIDLNISVLRDEDIQWADFVFLSAMSVQSASAGMVIKQCKLLNAKIVAGGPLFTEEYDLYPEIDHLVLNEAEITLPEFIDDVNKGTPRRKYETKGFADLTKSPLPDYSLLKVKNYATAGIQYSRGCPYDCEFCDITALLGHHVRTKSTIQIINELDQLYRIKWKGSVFFVDDNFIGHKGKLKRELLPAIIEWMEAHGNPFEFLTEASINLEDDKELMRLMVKAGFTKVFVGIETPEELCLAECNKLHNKNRDLINSIKEIQKHGMEVYGGFIVGFDNDTSGIFQRQIDFIQESGIITAMVGLLNAPRLSRLYKRLDGEGRISYQFSGDNTNGATNIIPVMNKHDLITGYKNIIRNIYSAKPYADRVIRFMKTFNPPSGSFRFSPGKMGALFKSVLYLGLLNRDMMYFWKIFFWSLLFRPRLFALAVKYSIYGYHFRKVFRDIIY